MIRLKSSMAVWITFFRYDRHKSIGLDETIRDFLRHYPIYAAAYAEVKRQLVQHLNEFSILAQFGTDFRRPGTGLWGILSLRLKD